MTTVINEEIKSWKIVDSEPLTSNIGGVLREEKSAEKRPEYLTGKTYGCRTMFLNNKLYITINDIARADDPTKFKPFEMFFESRDGSKSTELSVMSKIISGMFRRTNNPSFIIKELMTASGPETGYFRPPREGETKGRYIPSIYYEIGEILIKHLKGLGLYSSDSKEVDPPIDIEETTKSTNKPHNGLGKCPSCGEYGIKKESGCESCLLCEYSKCG